MKPEGAGGHGDVCSAHGRAGARVQHLAGQPPALGELESKGPPSPRIEDDIRREIAQVAAELGADITPAHEGMRIAVQ